MQKVIAYVVAKGTTTEELETEVEKLLKRGYQPHGSLLTAPVSGAYFCQAMTLGENKDPLTQI